MRGERKNELGLKVLPVKYLAKVAWAVETPCDFEYWHVCWNKWSWRI